MRAESFRLHVLAVPGSSLASVLVETRAEMSDVVGLETATSISIYITLFHHKLVDNKKMRKNTFSCVLDLSLFGTANVVLKSTLFAALSSTCINRHPLAYTKQINPKPSQAH